MTPEQSARNYWQSCLHVAAQNLVREMDEGGENWRAAITPQTKAEVTEAWHKYEVANEAVIAAAFARHAAG